jgi:para-aminobenzoate synthetase/4-amino-4-deoxychorismate lyase
MLARFDDLREGPRAFRFAGLRRVIEATGVDDVLPALRRVEDSVAEGSWAAGYVAYEAAPGLDADLSVKARSRDDPFADMPLLAFGIFDEREEVEPLTPSNASYSVSRWLPSVGRSVYDDAVERIRAHIAAGETYQVNHTMRLRGRFLGTDRALYAALCLAQRSSYCAYMDLGRYRILSASPELFFELTGDRLVTRPMKGTAPRGRTNEEDERLVEDLTGSEKERAENAMIVDLLRNDMGRISEPGSVVVTRPFAVERYETVWQLTSTVESRVPQAHVSGILRAMFPSGSVTGAPKVRSMQITAELEDSPRGVYTGAIGWIAPARHGDAAGSRACFNVAIRTVVLDAQTEIAEYGVGGGITYDSVPAAEYAECLAKARVLTARRPEFWLMESMLLEDGEILWLERHLARLRASASYFGFAFDEADVKRSIEAVAAGWRGDAPAKVRVELARDGSCSSAAEALGATGPVDVEIDEGGVDPDDPFLFHKTTVRATYESAAARHPAVGDVILTNLRGEITEATSSNVIAKIDSDWVTPPLACGLLPGVHRAALIESGEVRERVITPHDLRAAEGVVLVNSVRLRREARIV